MILTSTQTFFKSLSDAKPYEKESQQKVLAYYNQMEDGHTIGIEQDNTNHWRVHYDLEVLSPCKTKSILFEVKNNKRCKDTGNFFIEFAHGDGEPSGIRITTAHFHIFTNCDNYWMMPTSRILQVIQDVPLRTVSAKETFFEC
jgi:hypothetical protein